MQNEFDDHIKKRVEGFKLPPSAQVWDLVEAQLPEKKRRRFIFWWLPLAIILIGFGFYELNKNDKKTATINDNKITAEIKKTDKNDLINDSTKINNPNKINNNQNKKLDKPTVSFSEKIILDKILKNNNGVDAIELIKEDKGVALNNGTDLKISDKVFNDNNVPENNVLKELIKVDKIYPIATNKINKDEVNASKKENTAVNENLDSQVIVKSIDSSAINSAAKKTENIKNDSGLNKAKKVIKINLAKVKWELVAAFGKANTIENNLSTTSNSQYSSLPNSGVTTPGNTITQASLAAPTAGLSLAINLQRTTQITKQLAWYGSIGYNYLSNHQASGAFIDSIAFVGGRLSNNFSQAITADNDKVSNYYKYGNSLNHDNYNHLVNVSAGLKYSISNAFSINGGIGLGYSINSKWLQADLANSILYYSNKLTNKWNVSPRIGFNWQIAKPISVGVFYNYNFSKASLAAVQQNLHWQSFGATISVQLPFKK